MLRYGRVVSMDAEPSPALADEDPGGFAAAAEPFSPRMAPIGPVVRDPGYVTPDRHVWLVHLRVHARRPAQVLRHANLDTTDHYTRLLTPTEDNWSTEAIEAVMPGRRRDRQKAQIANLKQQIEQLQQELDAAKNNK